MIFNITKPVDNSEQIETMLNSFVSETSQVLTAFKTDVSSELAAFKSGINDQITALTNIINNVPKSAVKSVQRGTHGGSSSTENITININSVNPDKCLVLISLPRNSWTYAHDYFPQLVSIAATSITVSPSGSYSDGVMSPSSFSWQVIEFY